jgi:hypothetical protein
MTIKDIELLLESSGVKAPILSLIIFIIIILIKSDWFNKFLTKITDFFVENFMRRKTKDTSLYRSISESDISNHDIFNYLDFWKYSKVPTFSFSTEYRTIVFRKYLSIYLKSYKDNLYKYVSNLEYQKMDNAKLSTSLLNLINTIIFDYEREAQQVGIPSIIIEKMKIKNNETISLTLDLIEGVCSSEFYTSDKNLLKVYSILNILLSVLENTISSSEIICSSINGQLNGLTYNDNGKIITEEKKLNN